jgi:catechol 2,3-dioxygenase-like lactoylglutathione lyase family enzyme
METQPFPLLRQVVLDATDARALAEFYRKLLGYTYRPGDEPPGEGQPDEKGHEWLVLHDQNSSTLIAFQQVEALRRPTWPKGEVPQQLHLDMSVPTVADLEVQHRRALDLGATVLYDRSHDEEEPLWVFADPDGHPFCILVAPEPGRSPEA